ncbi:hypothetical protein CcaverHIS002_0310070 [Cutaneotrichosporon cavernicola]|uniref:NAD(P)-binding protein n=1 Tax=Cutaneotrichosporon cavernicola TaxID=279322 RepID=A0AA48L2H5_9TREE|nr:uncharacterized protein CcaverHIS019_0309920 [Cutaneotrichosporon cavernicola]BEI83139.1 hypothetical protein CcaverHIS002_0310070 [Cutaneotrichosporon cavernicola]BEI90922.1 hypothetical protein CcaverHIS019_0309920 [Cutaneotrichosporon cavernicola]BEI98700.1 hypothetical protein CcaverHIS631_0309990 [Cutaneotrichosporon cavernicola]BEJ06470.1 hypothetical protein CcaverHIS641_0309920 [Cutaneotrichosporon cavernicola]
MSLPAYYIVTGGTSGIGLEAAKAIASAKPNAKVIITGRSQPPEQLPANIELRQFDLGNLSEINAFVDGWDHPVSALLLNAGLAASGSPTFIDGVERTFAVNHLGGAALFFGLYDKGLIPIDARIILTSSGMHNPEMIGSPAKPHWTNAADVASAKEKEAQNPQNQYSNTKLANVLWSYALSRHSEDKGKEWTVAALDPGFVPAGGSKIFRESGVIMGAALVVMSYVPGLVSMLSGITTSTSERSGKALADLALSPGHKGERMAYYKVENKIESSKQSYDVGLQDDLWDWTIQKLGVKTDL